MILKTSHIKIFMMMVLVASMATGGVCFAENQLPEIMVGQSTLTVNGQNSYGGTVGNEVILNYDPNLLEGGKLLGFDRSELVLPCATILRSDANCYKLDPATTSMKLMTSRTNVNGSDVLEISTLLYPNITIVGDVYGVDNSNFALYGRNLKKNSEYATGETWNAGNSYALNTQAQAYFVAGGDSEKYFNKHKDILGGEASKDTSLNVSPWYLQNTSATELSSSPNMPAQFPEGKVWINSDVSTPTNASINTSDITYSGIGTVIITGNLTIGKSITGITLPTAVTGDHLGIIVYGDVTISPNVTVNATIFCVGKMNIGNNTRLNGSFVAASFNKANGSPIDNTSYGIQINYDYKLENNWPPGFRYFDMPSPENASP